MFQQRGQISAPGTRGFLSFGLLTPEEYAEQLRSEGVSEKFIEADVAALVKYRSDIDAERARVAETRQKRKTIMAEAEWVQKYLDADRRRVARTQERKNDA
jgi:hypothetical protein